MINGQRISILSDSEKDKLTCWPLEDTPGRPRATYVYSIDLSYID